MEKNQTNDRESEKPYRHNVDLLKRGGIHAQKEQSNLYPFEELAGEDDENISSNSDGNSLNSSSDVSPEKTKLRHRPGNERNNSSKYNQTSSYANKDQTETKQSSLIWIIVIAFIFVLVVFIFWSYPHKPAEDDINIENLMNDIKNKYNTQSKLTFRIVKSAIQRAVSESLTPGILILLASTEAKDTTKQLASHIANAVSKSSVYIKSDPLKSPEELKRDIDDTIQGNFSSNEFKAVYVDDLDRLPFEAAMIFHSYCDHENAPFTKALYVMTVSSDEKIPPTSDSKKFDTLASERLNSVWKNSGKDLSSLINRLTVSVAGVTA